MQPVERTGKHRRENDLGFAKVSWCVVVSEVWLERTFFVFPIERANALNQNDRSQKT